MIDTWKTSGLRGTGSHDMVVEDVHTMTQHIMVNEISLKPVGRVLFGLPTDLAQL